jgi:GT2 family glycosyltransferase
MAIVLNWNNLPDTLDCLQSLADCDYPVLQVLVVDNHSHEDPTGTIRARWPGVRVIRTERNLGYGGGNNVGLREALALGVPYVLLLNNDVTVDRGMVRRLVEPVTRDTRIGMATPTVFFHEHPSEVYWGGGVIDWSSAEASHESGSLPTRDGLTFSEWLDGCALLVRTEILGRVGLLDERYFLYYEDADWSLRAASQGWTNVVVAGARAWHKVSRTTGGKSNPAVQYYYARNCYFFLCLHGRGHLHRGWKARYARRLLASYGAAPDRTSRRALLAALMSIAAHRRGAMTEAVRPVAPLLPLVDAMMCGGLRMKRLLWRATRALRLSAGAD